MSHSPLVEVTQNERSRINKSFSKNATRMMQKRYLGTHEDGTQETPVDMFARVAEALARVDENYGHSDEFIKKEANAFFDILTSKEFTPAGRTLTNAGAETALIANCIVLPIEDSMEGIFQTLKDAALLQQAGSGLGFDFSSLRPAMAPTIRTQGIASGPVSFLKVYNEAFGTIKQQGRHGANMAMMNVDHPDILDFIHSKKQEGEIRNFNISVKVTDEFMSQVEEAPNTQWYCTWDDEKRKPQRVYRSKSGNVTGVEEVEITARELFDILVEHAWGNGEPGIVFIDEVNRTNPLPGLGPIPSSNPCGEQFLHPYDNCNLGSINLAAFATSNGTFRQAPRVPERGSVRGKQGDQSPEELVDWERLKKVTRLATRLLDNVIDLFDFPVEQVTELAQKNRRIGLGIMGFADLCYKLRVPYDSKEGIALAEKLMETINKTAHQTSRELGKEKGVFPNVDKSIFADDEQSPRNAALTTVAPTGSISMMFDTSSGVEPNFALSFVKQDKDSEQFVYLNEHFRNALEQYDLSEQEIEEVRKEVSDKGTIQHLDWLPEELRQTFVVSMDITAQGHMEIQAAFQRHVDNSISKTINFPNSATRKDVGDGFITAWKLGCKSCTVYRDGSRVVQAIYAGENKDVAGMDDLPDTNATKEKQEATKPTLENKKIREQPGQKANSLAPEQREQEKGLHPRSRPATLTGKTHRIKTGYGNMYVTINEDEDGNPFEVFATIGKTGGFFQEQGEAICRLISLSLRSGIEIDEVIDNLKGIRGPMPTITSHGTVLSLPDALGRILQIHIGQEDTEEESLSPDKEKVAAEVELAKANFSEQNSSQSSRTSIADYGVMPGCPDCGSKLQIAEGCMSCRSCGFSRCG